MDIGGWLRCKAGCSIRWRLPLVSSVNAWEISHRVPAGRSVLDSLGVMDIQLHVNSSFVLLFCFCFKPPWEILLNCFIVTVRVLLQIKVHCVHCGARNDVPLPERSLLKKATKNKILTLLKSYYFLQNYVNRILRWNDVCKFFISQTAVWPCPYWRQDSKYKIIKKKTKSSMSF